MKVVVLLLRILECFTCFEQRDGEEQICTLLYLFWRGDGPSHQSLCRKAMCIEHRFKLLYDLIQSG